MNIKDIMTSDADLVSLSTTVREAAEKMESKGIGFLPVGDNDELKGTLTDRDIVRRVVAAGKDISQTTIGEIFTDQVLYCREDQDVDEVARNMSEQQVRRLPVVNADKRLVGVVTIGDMAQHLSAETAGQVLAGVTADQRAA